MKIVIPFIVFLSFCSTLPLQDINRSNVSTSLSESAIRNLKREARKNKSKYTIPECIVEEYDFDTIIPIGKGGQAITYLLRSPRSPSMFVYKEYKREIEFLREVTFHSNVRHDNIVDVYCVIFKKKAIVMNFLKDGDMWHDGLHYRPDPNLLRKFSAQLVLAVEAMHREGYLHHDIKPHNLVRNGNDHIELIDFGLAVPIGQASPGRGTRITMAPEVARVRGYEKTFLNEGLDWWSVGATIYMFHTLKEHHIDDRSNGSKFVPYKIYTPDSMKNISGLSNDLYTNYMEFYDIPGHFDNELISLLSILMHPNPELRKFKTESELSILKNHQYFRGIDWKTVGKPQKGTI